LKLIPEDGKIRAINVTGLEDYLKSVISSEMSATSSPELLKAHAVISRSWLLAQIEKTKSLKTGGGLYQTSHETEDEIIRWYDREDHTPLMCVPTTIASVTRELPKFILKKHCRLWNKHWRSTDVRRIKFAMRVFQMLRRCFRKF
jgi:hypothetical protein